MKKMQTFPRSRNRERGAVAVVVAFAWTALFGMAVLAVDFGYLYAKRRGVQAAADIALRASMPGWVSNYPNGYSSATNTARNVANANGFSSSYGDSVVTREDIPNNLFTVSITRTFPTFIGGMFGYSGKTVTGTAVGRRNAVASNAAIHADGNNPCLGAPVWGVGFFPQGAATLVVNGDVESNTQIALEQSGGGNITGNLKTPCPTPLSPTFNVGTTVATQTSAGAPYADPFAGSTIASLNAFCTVGTLSTPLAVGLGWVNAGGPGGCDTPTNAVFCSSADITVAPAGSNSICAGSRATFMSAARVIIGASNSITLQPATGAPNNFVIVSFNNTGSAGCAAGAIDMGSAGNYTLTGNVYAPNGCIWFAGAGGGPLGFTMTGQMVGRHIALGMQAGSTWTFNGPGGSPSSAWTLYQ